MPEIFQFDFMIRAFAAGLIVAVVAPLIGTFIVVRRLSLMAETLAHVSLLGIAIGLFAGIKPIIAATVTAIAVSLGIEKIRTNKKIFSESVLALFFSGSLAAAAVLMSLKSEFNRNLFSYLFGSITTVTNGDLILISALAVIAILILILLYKELFLVSFDEELAKVNGVKAEIINIILIVLAAITVSLSIRIVGILLIGALMVIPVITAMQLGKSFKQILAYSVGISLTSVISGLFLSYYFNLSSGGTIVLIAIALFVGSLVLKRTQ